MVARRTPPKQRKMVAPLNPTILRETLNKVEKSIARLQELQYTVAGGTKVISGVSLSPRSTKGYLKCKHECLRIKNANSRKSPPGKLPTSTGEWRRMSLPAMLVGETVGEILQASQFAREIVEAVAAKSEKSPTDDPKTPATLNRKQSPNLENSELRAWRNREKQNSLQSIRSESHTPSSLHRARSRINFKASSPPPLHNKESEKENSGYRANRVSPRNRPWARKTVLFPNPLFHSSSSPTSNHHKFCKTKSPIIVARNRQTPHKFLIKKKSPPPSACKFQVKIKSPPPAIFLSPTKLPRSFSPSRLASRLVSPLKSRKSVQKSDGLMMMMMMMSGGLKQRQISMPIRFSAPRI